LSNHTGFTKSIWDGQTGADCGEVFELAGSDFSNIKLYGNIFISSTFCPLEMAGFHLVSFKIRIISSSQLYPKYSIILKLQARPFLSITNFTFPALQNVLSGTAIGCTNLLLMKELKELCPSGKLAIIGTSQIVKISSAFCAVAQKENNSSMLIAKHLIL
jgi:hypothetical protein